MTAAIISYVVQNILHAQGMRNTVVLIQKLYGIKPFEIPDV